MIQSVNSNVNFGCKLTMGEAILLGSGRKEANKIIADMTGNKKFMQFDSSLVRASVADMMQNIYPKLSDSFRKALSASPYELERIVADAEIRIGKNLDVSTDAVKTSAYWAKDAIDLMG